MTITRLPLVFPDNRYLIEIFGEHNQHLKLIEQTLTVEIATRGNELTIIGAAGDCQAAAAALEALYQRVQLGKGLDLGDVEAALRFVGNRAQPEQAQAFNDPKLHINTRKKPIGPRSANQGRYIAALAAHELVFGVGPAGTGKTYLAVAKAVECLASGKVERIILSRPAVEAGEQLGFLPGDMREKLDPYLRPLYDALHDMLPADVVEKKLETNEIEIAPLAFMRGRTLSRAFVILDEAQNTTAVQMKMFLTRLGEGSRMVVTGDLSQVDLPRGTISGLAEAVAVLSDIKGICIHRFQEADIVRHPLVARIVHAYGEAGIS